MEPVASEDLVVRRSGDVALITGTVRQVANAGGAPYRRTSRFLDVYRRVGGR